MFCAIARTAAVAVCVVGATSAANAELIDFDDIDLGGEAAVLPIGNYVDLYFANFGCYTDELYNQGGYGNGVVSGTQAAYQAYAAPASVIATSSAELSLDFYGGSFTAGWRDDLEIRVRAFVGGDNEEIYNEVFQISTNGPTFLEFNIEGARMVTFESFGGTNAGFGVDGTNFIMDDLYMTIPAPAGMLLLGLGVIGGRSRRRN